MLVLHRKAGEKIFIGSDIVVTVIDTRSGQARIGIDAPKETVILREEVYLRDQQEGNKNGTSNTV